METKVKNLIVNRPGGTASKNAYQYKINFPKDWIEDMGCSINDKEVRMTFDGDRIIIEKNI